MQPEFEFDVDAFVQDCLSISPDLDADEVLEQFQGDNGKYELPRVLETVFQLRGYDYGWLVSQFRRNDLALTNDAKALVIHSIYQTATEFERPFLGSKLVGCGIELDSLMLKTEGDWFAIGEEFDRIRIVDRIGMGGALLVYRGATLGDGLSVAVRVPRKTSKGTTATLHNLLRTEFALLERLSEYQMVGIQKQLRWLETDFGPVSICEFIDGITLSRMVGTSLSAQEALRIVRELARIVEQLHVRGIIHRDIKPENIIVDNAGSVFLLDLNVAVPSDITAITVDRFPGTFAYMSIETIAGGASEVSIQRDVYSLGALLFELVEQKPFISATTKEDAFAAIAVNVGAIQDRFTDKTSVGARSVIECATAIDPVLRFDGCASFVDALDQAIENPEERVLPKRNPVVLAFRLGLSIGEIDYLLRLVMPVLTELENVGSIKNLHQERQIDLLGVVGIGEESKRVAELLKDLKIHSSAIDPDQYFVRAPIHWAVRDPTNFDELRLRLEQARVRYDESLKSILTSFADFSERLNAFKFGANCVDLSGHDAVIEFTNWVMEHYGLSFNDAVAEVIKKSESSSRRKRVQALAVCIENCLRNQERLLQSGQA